MDINLGFKVRFETQVMSIGDCKSKYVNMIKFEGNKWKLIDDGGCEEAVEHSSRGERVMKVQVLLCCWSSIKILGKGWRGIWFGQ